MEVLLRTLVARVEVMGAGKRRPLGMKEWSRQAFRMDMWQENVAMGSVRYEVFLARVGQLVQRGRRGWS